MRVVSATNADLDAEVAAGRFRQDLLFRLNTIEIRLPPLRERREDIPRAGAALPPSSTRSATASASPASTRGAMQVLLEHPWPGNVRELDHAIERAVLMAPGRHGQARRDLGLRATAREAAAASRT